MNFFKDFIYGLIATPILLMMFWCVGKLSESKPDTSSHTEKVVIGFGLSALLAVVVATMVLIIAMIGFSVRLLF